MGVMITMSQFPVPTVNWGDHMSEFVGSLVRCLNWNDREVRIAHAITTYDCFHKRRDCDVPR